MWMSLAACFALDLWLLKDGQKVGFSFLLPGCQDIESFCGIMPVKWVCTLFPNTLAIDYMAHPLTIMVGLMGG